jgi:hypothetical protein
MGEEPTNLVEKAAYQMDKAMAGVMPDSWEGHARIALVGRDLSEKKKAKVLEHTANIVEDTGHPSDKVAEKVIEKLGY